jgi:hypothetical protein
MFKEPKGRRISKQLNIARPRHVKTAVKAIHLGMVHQVEELLAKVKTAQAH